MTPAAPDLLADRNPVPEDLGPRLREQFTFLLEVDKLKTVLRQSPLAAARRRENDAEHSWHLAMTILVLAEYADESVDLGHAIALATVHDLVEIYAGDTPLHNTAAEHNQRQRESAAADRLFGLLPDEQGRVVRALWEEFEARQTPEARFAKAADRLQPVLLNWLARGGTWRAPGVNAEAVLDRTAGISDASATLWTAVKQLVAEAERRGWFRRTDDVNRGLAEELTGMATVDNESSRLAGGDLADQLAWRRITGEHAERLSQIMDEHGWPGVWLVGEEAARAAWLLAQHADRRVDVQRRALRLMEQAVAAGDASETQLAFLRDRTLVNEGRPQVYGTQIAEVVDGEPVPWPCEQPERMDELRAEVGIEPFAVYTARTRDTMFQT